MINSQHQRPQQPTSKNHNDNAEKATHGDNGASKERAIGCAYSLLYCRGRPPFLLDQFITLAHVATSDDVLLIKCLSLLLVDYVLELCQNGELLTYIKKVRDPALSNMETDITMLH